MDTCMLLNVGVRVYVCVRVYVYVCVYVCVDVCSKYTWKMYVV